MAVVVSKFRSWLPKESFPLVRVRVPLTVVVLPNETPAALFKVRLSKVEPVVPPTSCGAAPFRLKVLPVAVNVAS